MTVFNQTKKSESLEPPESSVYKKILDKLRRSNITILVILFTTTIILGALVNPAFLRFQNIQTIMRACGIIGITGLGATAVLLAGEMDISMGALMSFTTLLGGMLIGKVPGVATPVFLTLVFGLITGAFIGLIITRLKITAIMATLGAMNLFSGLAYLLTSGLNILLYDAPLYSLMGKGYLLGVPNSFVAFVFLSIFSHVVLSYTSFGKKVYFTGANSKAAWLSGVNTSLIKVVCFAFSGMCSALAGMFLAGQTNQLIATLGVGYELSGIAIAVLGGTAIGGGRGSVLGTFLGALTYQSLLNLLALSGLGTYVEQVLRGALLIIIVVTYAVLNKRKLQQG